MFPLGFLPVLGRVFVMALNFGTVIPQHLTSGPSVATQVLEYQKFYIGVPTVWLGREAVDEGAFCPFI
jgi:hypothetical protein